MIKPEKLVEQQIRAWCFSKGIWVEIYDSKGTFSEPQGRYTKNQGMRNGVPDLLGLNSFGIMVAIELKSPGKEKVARLEQLQFLLRVIEKNGFGCVVSSPIVLDQLYSQWLSLDMDSRQKLLKESLPKKALIGKKIMDFIL